MLNPLKAEVSQIITQGDIEAIAEQIDNNSTAEFMLIENLWAKKTQQAICFTIHLKCTYSVLSDHHESAYIYAPYMRKEQRNGREQSRL